MNSPRWAVHQSGRLRRLGHFFASPEFVLSTIICMAVCLPYIARILNKGSSIHPVTFAVAGVSVLLVIFRFRPMRLELTQRWPLYVGGIMVAVVGLATTLTAQGDHGKAYVVNQLIVPLAFFAITQVMLRRNAAAIRTIAMVIVVVGCVQAVLGAAQIVTQGSILYSTWYAEYPWFETMIAENRAVGTLDHSLVLGLFLFIAICFAQYLSPVWLRWGAVTVLMGGMLLTQSRLSMVLAVLTIAVFLFRDESLARYRRWAAVAAVLAGALFAMTPAGRSLIGRFQEDMGSTDRRMDALRHFGTIWQNYIVTGGGFGSSGELSKEAALKSTLENPFLMMVVDIGLIWALIWFGMQLLLALGFSLKWRREPVRQRATLVQWAQARWAVAPAFAAALGSFAFTQTFSSTANQSAASLLVWFCLAILAVTLEASDESRIRDSLEFTRSGAAGGNRTIEESSIA